MGNRRLNCPFCGDTRQRFYVRDDGVYYCHNGGCNVKGHINSLEKDLVDKINLEPLIETKPFDKDRWEATTELTPRAREYLITRLHEAERPIKIANLRWDERRGAICFPVEDRNGEVFSVYMRTISTHEDQRWECFDGTKKGQFKIKGAHTRSCLLVEGQFDALAASLAGFNGEIRALGGDYLSDSVVADVRSFREVFFIPDEDEAGQRAIVDIQTKIPQAKVIKLPKNVKDFSEWYQKERDEAATWLLVSTRDEVQKISLDITKVPEKLLAYRSDTFRFNGISSGWSYCDPYFTLRPGELIVVNSQAKKGKSTFIKNLTYHLIQEGFKGAIAPFEERPVEDFMPTLYSMAAGKSVYSLPDSEMLKLNERYSRIKNQLHIYGPKGKQNKSVFIDWLKYNVVDNGIKFAVIDHVEFLMKSPHDVAENNDLAQELSDLARDLDLILIAVVQSPVIRTKDGKASPLDLTTAYGGGAWGRQCSLFLTLERRQEKLNDRWVNTDVTELRNVGGRNTRNKLTYEPISLTYDHNTGKLNQ